MQEYTLSQCRRFGLLFAVLFMAIGLWPLIDGAALRPLALLASIALLVVGGCFPGLLFPLLKAWMALGLLMNAIVSPLVMGVIFFLVVTPIGLIMRLFGKDFLRLKPHADSYWRPRQPPGPEAGSMKNQF